MNTFKQYFVKLLFITVSILILSAPLVLLQVYYPETAHSVSGFITEYFWVFTVLRLMLIIGIIVIWPVCIRRFAKNYEWSAAKTQFWLGQQFRIMAWMIVVELLVCQNIVFHLFF